MSETCLPCPPTKLDNNETYAFSFYEDIVQVSISSASIVCAQFIIVSSCCALGCVSGIKLSEKFALYLPSI
jgi:hypothetical protein